MPGRVQGARLLALTISSCVVWNTVFAAAPATPPSDSAQRTALGSADPSVRARLVDAYGKLPLIFETNQGQTDAPVKFLARGPGYRMLLTGDGVVISLKQPQSSRSDKSEIAERDATISFRLAGASKPPQPAGEIELASRSNYFIGGAHARAITNVPHYARVRYSAVYPGIDFVCYGNQQQFEYDFIVAPHSDPSLIQLSVEGADSARIAPDGDLVLQTVAGEIRQRRPNIYQEFDGVRKKVDGGYAAVGERRIGFWVAQYDHERPLVIDPVLSYSTYLGGTALDYGMAIAVDSAGNAYIAGFTESSSFPLVTPYDKHLGNRDFDAFVSKFNATGTSLVYSTFLGGSSGLDYARGIAVDSAGNAYVVGTTTGSDFPTTSGGYQLGTSAGGSFVTKLAAAGNVLLYSTYVRDTSATAIALDSNNNAYITGTATSSFATTAGAFQAVSRNPSGSTPFVLKLNGSGSAPLYATFLGGSGPDAASGITVDSSGNAYVAGKAVSTDFPTVSPFQSTLSGAGKSDAFVSKLNASGNALVYSTYLGGSDYDAAAAIAVDAAGNAYVTGYTQSVDFPLQQAFQTHINNGDKVAFVSKLGAVGNTLVYSTYLGIGCGRPCGYGGFGLAIAVDRAGHAFVAGRAESQLFPLVDSLEPALRYGDYGMFVSELSATGGALLFSTSLGNVSPIGVTLFVPNVPNDVVVDAATGIAVDGSGNAYVTGTTSLTTFPVTSGAFQTVNGSNYDAVALKLSPGSVNVTLASSETIVNDGQSIVLTAAVTGGSAGGTVSFMDGANTLSSTAVINGSATLTTMLAVGIHELTAIYRDGNNEGESTLVYQVINPKPTCN